MLRMNEESIPKKVSNNKIKGKCLTGKPRSRWEQQGRKDEGRRNIGEN
jgi:hypothetical protein